MNKILKRFVSTLLATMVIAGTAISSFAAQDVEKVNAFVERCYTVILGRGSDPVGKAYWVNGLLSGERTGIAVAYGFVFSDEYKDYNKSDEAFLTDLYNTFLEGRNPDPTGWNYWLTRMANGEDDKQVIFNGFACSQEFMAYCANYGIQSGDAMPGYESARRNRPIGAPQQQNQAPVQQPAPQQQTSGVTENATYTINTSNGPVTITGHFDIDRENQILAELNAHRAANGLAPVAMTDDLRETARIRSVEIAYMFSHSRPDGSRCFTAFPSNYAARAENIAAGSSSASTIMELWRNSNGHNANMLNPDYTHVGIGCFVATSNDNAGGMNPCAYTNYYTQSFGN